jgi:hypothetical protein
MGKDTFTREEVLEIVGGYVKLLQNQEDMIQKLQNQLDKDNIQFEKNNQILYKISKLIESEE